MAIAFDTTGSTKLTSGGTSATVDITAAATGSFVYCWIAGGSGIQNFVFAGWTRLFEGDEAAATYYGLFRRQKVAGDTTFTLSWTTSQKATIGWASYTGLDPVTPEELARVTLHTSGTTYPSPSLTPAAADRWALYGAYSRDTALATNLPDGTAWTPDGALTERLDAANQAAATSPWLSLELADSAGAVTLAAHSYTATAALTESHGGQFLLFLVPAGAGVRPPLPHTGGAQWRRMFLHRQQVLPAAAIVTAATAGPPVYPLGHPVMARQLPQSGGRTGRRAGVYAQAGPPVRAAEGPVRARVPQPSRGGSVNRRSGVYGGAGPAVKALASAVAGKLRGLPPRGRTAGRSGVYGQLGPAVRPATGPVRARQLPIRGGSAQGRAGTFTAVALGSGPPVYPLGHPVQARRLPLQGGRITRAAGAYGGTGAPVRPPTGPVKAQPAPARGGRAVSRAGTLTAGGPQAGPPIYPLAHPVQARRQPVPGGRVVRRAGTYAGTGPPVRALQQPVGVYRQQPPPPTRGRTASQRGPYGQTGPPVVRLRRPVRGQPQRPLLTGRAAWRAGVYTAPAGPPPFTVGALTASAAPGAALTASGAPTGVMTAATASGVLTALTAPTAATDSYEAAYQDVYGARGGSLTATDTRTGGPG